MAEVAQTESWKELAKLPPEELARIPYNDPRLDAFAATVEQRYNLPPGFIEAVKNAGERSNTTQVSSAGAKGVMQFIDSTRKLYPHDYKNPLASIDASGQYFSDLMKQYKGNVKAMVAHYNGGTVAGKAILAGEEAPKEETRNYWKRLQGYMEKKQKVTEAPVNAAVPPVAPQDTFMDKVKRAAPPFLGGDGELVSKVFK
jgi:soluble lytic murein transglycosylase-like protein